MSPDLYDEAICKRVWLRQVRLQFYESGKRAIPASCSPTGARRHRYPECCACNIDMEPAFFIGNKKNLSIRGFEAIRKTVRMKG